MFQKKSHQKEEAGEKGRPGSRGFKLMLKVRHSQPQRIGGGGGAKEPGGCFLAPRWGADPSQTLGRKGTVGSNQFGRKTPLSDGKRGELVCEL